MGRANDKSLPHGTDVGLVSVSPVVAATNATFDDFTVSKGNKASASVNLTPAATSGAAKPSAAGGGGGGSRVVLPHVDDIALHNDANGQPGTRQSLFDTGQNRIYVVLEISGNIRVKFEAKWFAIQGAEETSLIESEYDNTSGDSRIWFYADRNWNAGLYRVNVYADGQLLEELEFSIY